MIKFVMSIVTVLAVISGAASGSRLIATMQADRTGEMTAPPDSPQSTAGRVLEFPACIPMKWLGNLDYSPDGTKLAIEASGSIYVWDLNTGEVLQIDGTPDDARYGACLNSAMFWADECHLLVDETQVSQAEVAAHVADRSAPHPTVTSRWVLFDARSGERVRVNADYVNGDEDGLRIMGTQDADVWYILARDGKLRTYDSRLMQVGDEAYFDYGAARGVAEQISPGSDWFAAIVPEGPSWPGHRASKGPLEVLNIVSGELRSAPEVYVGGGRILVTPDGRYAFTVTPDENAFPVIHDLVLGMEIPLPPGERWLPQRVSVARGVLLVYVLETTRKPYDYIIHWFEVPLSYLIAL